MADINEVGDPCRNCENGIVFIKQCKVNKKIKAGQNYGFTHYFSCNICNSMYHHEKFKYKIDKSTAEISPPNLNQRVEKLEDQVRTLMSKTKPKEVNK